MKNTRSSMVRSSARTGKIVLIFMSMFDSVILYTDT